MPTTAHRIGALAVLAGIATSAMAMTPSLDFGVEDQATYDAFRDAIAASEYVRYDYVYDRKPRVVGVAAGLVVFATRNPLATEAQLQAFVDAYDAALAAHAPGDPDLLRSSSLMTAIRFSTPIDGTPELAGMDTDVGAETLELLGLGVPPPQNYDSMRQRMVRFDRARVKGFANSTEWSTVLVVGFSGRDLAGEENAWLADALQGYLESEGYEPAPDGIDDARFAPVDAGLASSLPADFAAYSALLADPMGAGSPWASVSDESTGAFRQISLRTQDRLDDIADELSDEPTLVEGVANATDPQIMDALVEQYRARIDEVAQPRTIIAANAMILLQSSDPSIRNLAERARDFSEAQLETNDTMAGVAAGVQYVGGLAQLGVGIATGSPGDAISGLMNSALGGLELAGIFGDSPPSAEEQIFDEMVEMRDQIEDMRVQMNQRFDRIEVQLDLVYGAIATGFNALGMQIGDLTDSVEDLTRDMVVAHASLERIEDALWGMAEDILEVFIADLANDTLAYRSGGSDLPYDLTSPSFRGAASDFFTVATTISSNTTFAGDEISTLTAANAADRLNNEPIGRNINDLRVFPTQLGLPALKNTRIAAPAPWAQAAGGYAQIARENPWYFAYLYEQQQGALGSNAHLDLIIGEGEDIAETAAAARGPMNPLFETLFARYDEALQDISDRVDTIRESVMLAAGLLTPQGVEKLDPWAGLGQEVSQHAPTFTSIQGQDGLGTMSLPNGIGSDCWNLFGEINLPEIAAVINGQLGDVHMIMTANGFGVENDVLVRLRYYPDGDSPTCSARWVERWMVWEIYVFGDARQINSDNSARDIFEEDFFFWTQVRTHLLSGENLFGKSFFALNGNEEQVEIVVTTDSMNEGLPPFNPCGHVPSVTTFALSTLNQIQDDVWTMASSDGVIETLAPLLPGYEALIEAYATLALPDMMEASAVARAALRADPATGELSLSFTEPVTDLLASRVGNGDSGQYLDLHATMAPRAAIAEAEVLGALASPAAGHSFLDWTLAELRNIKANASRLAVDDTYRAPRSGSLVVGAQDGVLANDVDQQFRVIEVDTGFVGVEAQHGDVVMNADGSFSYTPDPGFAGVDEFTYRSFADVFACPDYDPNCFGGGPDGTVYSEPATVRVLVPCPGDANGDDVVDFSDLNAVLAGYGATGDGLPGDLNEDGVVDFSDLNAVLAVFGGGCTG